MITTLGCQETSSSWACKYIVAFKKTEEIIFIPLVRMVKQIHIPLYLEVYISAAFRRGKILDP